VIIRYTVTHWYSFLPIFNCFDYICGLTGAADPASGDGFFLILPCCNFGHFPIFPRH